MIRIMSSLPRVTEEVIHIVVTACDRPVCGVRVVRLEWVGHVIRDEGAGGHGSGECELLWTLLGASRWRNRAYVVWSDSGRRRNMGVGRLLVIHHESLVPVASIDYRRRCAQTRPADDRR